LTATYGSLSSLPPRRPDRHPPRYGLYPHVGWLRHQTGFRFFPAASVGGSVSRPCVIPQFTEKARALAMLNRAFRQSFFRLGPSASRGSPPGRAGRFRPATNCPYFTEIAFCPVLSSQRDLPRSRNHQWRSDQSKTRKSRNSSNLSSTLPESSALDVTDKRGPIANQRRLAEAVDSVSVDSVGRAAIVFQRRGLGFRWLLGSSDPRILRDRVGRPR